MSFTPVALVFGVGKNIGAGVAAAFAAKGYKIATISRAATLPQVSHNQSLHIQCDLSDPSGVSAVFERVRKELGQPSVVVYNAYGHSHSDKINPLSIPLETAQSDLNTNALSALAAAQEAVKSFDALDGKGARTFISTGNILNNQIILPPLLSLGVGKSAAAYIIQSAADAYKDRGFKFYYADERTGEGKPVYNAIDGAAHGDFYVELSEGKEQGHWLATFVKGKGYVDFTGKHTL
ncbi:NAD(P)-binding protein [Viridothelium virens]|uniref:NAD(P)-binding protein n=1 Tax=Viridothelium virens TaxID=1048519 RepID=A0A6A6H1H0_VIRVR|nr:NAD(P)-binding protein [Viridothelium virens]